MGKVGEVTLLLAAAQEGQADALNRLFDLLYPDLRRIASARMRKTDERVMLDTTSLVHECYMRLLKLDELSLNDRGHFLAYAAKVMRSVVVDLAREHFPHLKLVARARDVTHWNALRDRGVTELDRELFESSLSTGQRVLQALGLTADEAQAVAQRFKQHNTQLLADMYPHHKDRSKLIAVARQGRQQLEEQMARERAERVGQVNPGTQDN